MSSSMDMNNMSKLTMAAEELIKAASTHVETTSLALGQETVTELKKISKGSSSLESKIESLNQNLSKLATTNNNNFTTLSLLCVNVKASIDDLNKSVALQTKAQRLDWAMDHTNLESFKYFQTGRSHYHGSSEPSTELVKLILMSFRKGLGCYIHNNSINVEHGKEAEAAFREAISTQIYALLGTKPRVEPNGDKWVIYQV